MIRVAMIIGKMNVGGKKNLVMEYYRHIDKNIFQFDFICDSDSLSIPEDEIRQLGGRVYKVSPYQHILSNMLEMRKIFIENNYQIVHAWNSTMNVFPMLVAKSVGIPVRISESISMAHNKDKKTILKNILKCFSKLFVTHFVSCGEDCGRWQFGNKLFDNGKVDVFKTVINTHNYDFNPNQRCIVRKKYGWEKSIVIGHIGRFTFQKNTLQLLDIFAAIHRKEPKARLCLIGYGELYDEITNRINKYKINDFVDYLGKREDLQQFYNAMDCFVLPSLYEGLPVVGLEAECCGLPMFFSSEITREANACELGHYISLNESDDYWADEILKACMINMPIRRGYSNEVAIAGFDSLSESIRLQKYYIDALNKSNFNCAN